jgi:hypothetical protein
VEYCDFLLENVKCHGMEVDIANATLNEGDKLNATGHNTETVIMHFPFKNKFLSQYQYDSLLK